MSLRGYIRKSKPAPWLQMSNAKAAPPAKPKKRIAPVSSRKRVEVERYRLEARKFIADARAGGIRCPLTGEMPVEVHHIRGRIGKLLRDQRYWVAMSSSGHRWIHDNPKEAMKMGLLAGRGEWGVQKEIFDFNAVQRYCFSVNRLTNKK